jgi:glycosyltransferase involved in cell wall biosynthesis
MSELRVSEQKKYLLSQELSLSNIIVTCYHSGNSLSRAIDSALPQTHPVKKIMVVDVGSTDNSRYIINSYEDQIIPVFKENGGVTSVTNASFFVSQGAIFFFGSG